MHGGGGDSPAPPRDNGFLKGDVLGGTSRRRKRRLDDRKLDTDSSRKLTDSGCGGGKQTNKRCGGGRGEEEESGG